LEAFHHQSGELLKFDSHPANFRQSRNYRRIRLARQLQSASFRASSLRLFSDAWVWRDKAPVFHEWFITALPRNESYAIHGFNKGIPLQRHDVFKPAFPSESYVSPTFSSSYYPPIFRAFGIPWCRGAATGQMRLHNVEKPRIEANR
jgi:hypothetical protein